MSPIVAVAMSGGVDSSTTAALLKQKGFQVFGITLQIWSPEMFPEKRTGLRGCCSYEAIDDARAVCEKLAIPHYLLNFREIFEKEVIGNFIHEYLNGRTPNPCIVCNKIVKFKYLLEKIRAYNADYLATGHYARIINNEQKQCFSLKKAIDEDKDQSYFLYNLNQKQLSKLLMPLGEYKKSDTRKMAKNFNLPVAEKDESQEICFIPDDNYRRFLKEKVPETFRSGDIIDRSGKVLGKHQGFANYTVGQRKGLGIAAKKPLYVLRVIPEANQIVVGFEDELEVENFTVRKLSFISGKPPGNSFKAYVKIRYRSEEIEAGIKITTQDELKVHLNKKQKGVAPGQAAVFYSGHEVIGGGIIASDSTLSL